MKYPAFSRKFAVVIGAVLACAAFMRGTDARSDGQSVGGTGAVYGYVAPDQVEFLSSPQRIMDVVAHGPSTTIWETLEHGEKVECLECIPAVSNLLYDANANTREIAAWWLRRRIFGVFGPGEVYQQTLQTLKSDSDPVKRADAAQALGEFLAKPGVAACAAALTGDGDAGVRAAAAKALGRLRDDGGGALGSALTDKDVSVKISALDATTRVPSWTGASAVAPLLADGDAVVRRRALQVLDSLGVKENVAAVIALAKGDSDPEVRLAACHALGSFGDASARAALEQVQGSDSNGLVRDQARIALRRL